MHQRSGAGGGAARGICSFVTPPPFPLLLAQAKGKLRFTMSSSWSMLISIDFSFLFWRAGRQQLCTCFCSMGQKERRENSAEMGVGEGGWLEGRCSAFLYLPLQHGTSL